MLLFQHCKKQLLLFVRLPLLVSTWAGKREKLQGIQAMPAAGIIFGSAHILLKASPKFVNAKRTNQLTWQVLDRELCSSFTSADLFFPQNILTSDKQYMAVTVGSSYIWFGVLLKWYWGSNQSQMSWCGTMWARCRFIFHRILVLLTKDSFSFAIHCFLSLSDEYCSLYSKSLHITFSPPPHPTHPPPSSPFVSSQFLKLLWPPPTSWIIFFSPNNISPTLWTLQNSDTSWLHSSWMGSTWQQFLWS